MVGDYDLFSYPQHPGYKERGQTSQAAAESMADEASRLRKLVLEALVREPRTVHEIAKALNLTIPSVQPRFSELRADGKIEPTGDRRKNDSGRSAHVWRVKSG